MRILVLGHNGMLGNAVVKYLSKFYTVDTINYRWPDQNFIDSIKSYSGDYLINCIGSIPQKNCKDYSVNSILPVFLDLHSNQTIIHPSTDCEKDSTIYGISKKLSSDWLINNGVKTYLFRSSIIGIEIGSSYSLLSWFLNQREACGYTDAKWNGITSLEWAKQCKKLIDDKYSFSKLTVLSTECISKLDLLCKIKKVYSHDIKINSLSGVGENKCLKNGIELGCIEKQLFELKEFYEQ